jgi:cytochrome P450
VGGVLPREVLKGGLSVTGKWNITAGVDVGVPIYALHHDERYWTDAHSFNPGRWLRDDCEDNKRVSTPFGVGSNSGCANL